MHLFPNPNLFAGAPLDRASEKRRDADWIARARAEPTGRLLALQEGRPLLDDDGPVWLALAALETVAGRKAEPVFLGVDPAGAPHFAVSVPASRDLSETPIAGLGEFTDLRAAAPRLAGPDAAILGQAKSILGWHETHPHCARCGAETQMAEAGWKRVCPSCGAEHFPRTDPVVIMLATHGERALLGRQKMFPRGMYSALAGFLEPGESIEEACARELKEEAGLTARQVTIHSSQPWPFPSQLMIGLIAETTDDAATPDHDELEQVIWVSREEARAMLDGGLKRDGQTLWSPPPMAIAHHLLKSWAQA
jgi:NAD+ diphosphatase